MSLGNWGVSQLRDAAGAFFGSDYLRDYTHASRTFRNNSYQYSPKLKFLFHVAFEFNPAAYDIKVNAGGTNNLSLAVKTVALPSYGFDTHVMNQYNRKRIVQTKIKYDPIDITFHDDNGNLVRDMWYNYYSYYYNDPNRPMKVIPGDTVVEVVKQMPNNGATVQDYTKRTQYDPPQAAIGNGSWGYIGETKDSINSNTLVATGQTKVPFFKNITVFGFNQHNFVAYTLINPIITRFAHDQYNYNEGNGIMENKMTVDYETVKYFSGSLNGLEPSRVISTFANPGVYDRTPSPIARPGSQATILGQGGLVDAGNGIIKDLFNSDPPNIIGAIQKAGTTYNTFKNKNLTQLASNELKSQVFNAVIDTPNRNNLFQFPASGQTPGRGQAGQTNGLQSPPRVQGR